MTRCGQCSYQSKNISARKIEPLSRVSSYVQEKLKERRKFLRAKGEIRATTSNTAPSSPPLGRAVPFRRHETSTLARHNITQEHLRDDLPGIAHTLQPIQESSHSLTSSDTLMPTRNTTPGDADKHGTGITSPRKPSSSASTYIGSSSSPSHHSVTLSRHSSRIFTPPPFPSRRDTTDLPEVVDTRRSKLSNYTSHQSLSSDASSSILHPTPRKWPFKSRRAQKGSITIPSATFFASGRALLLWNDRGACYYDLQNMISISQRIITPGDILLAAGGTWKSGIVSRNGPVRY
jgi:hypothetical protein